MTMPPKPTQELSGRNSLIDRVRDFIRTEVLPIEQRVLKEHLPLDETLRQDLVARARAAGLLTIQAGVAWGGRGLSHSERAEVFEAAGYSYLGPTALNCAAPDEGNMHMLELVASEAQKIRWLAPMIAGRFRSAFLMTEPGGAGADPSLLATTARRDGEEYVISGRKWFITGAKEAGLAIIMARVEGEAGEAGGPTMFLTPMDTRGILLVRDLGTAYHDSVGGHWVVDLDQVRVHRDAVLGTVGLALRYAQMRLAPARLTHCMRWLGAGQRAHDIACAYAMQRSAFGKPLIEHEGIGFMLADNEMDLFLMRTLVRNCAQLLDSGADGRDETSMVKVICSEAVYRVADRAVQILGGVGITDETVVDHIHRSVRAFRIYDGPSEVHRWSIARSLARRLAKAPDNGLSFPQIWAR